MKNNRSGFFLSIILFLPVILYNPACKKDQETNMAVNDSAEPGGKSVENSDIKTSPDERAGLILNRRKSESFLVHREMMFMRQAHGEAIWSKDHRKAAYVGTEGSKKFVVVNGTEYKRYDAIKENSLKFSSDSSKIVYIAQDLNLKKEFVVVNSEEGKKYDAVADISFSPDNSKVSYTAREGNDEILVAGGIEDKACTGRNSSILAGSLIFSSDRAHYAYKCSTSQGVSIAADGKMLLEGELLKALPLDRTNVRFNAAGMMFGKDGNLHTAYNFSIITGIVAYHVGGAKYIEKKYAFIDGKKYDGEFRMFSPDGDSAVIVEEEGKTGVESMRVVIAGREKHKKYQWIKELSFSSGRNSLSYIASPDGAKMLAVINGIESKPYAQIAVFSETGKEKSIIFSPDGSRNAFIAQDQDGMFLVADRIEGRKISDGSILFNSITYSTDGKRLGYLAIENSEIFAVIDGTEGKRHRLFNKIANVYGHRFAFSSNGKHAAYYIEKNEKGDFLIVADGKEIEGYDSAFAPAYSPDEKMLLFFARKGSEWFVVVNGDESSIGSDRIPFSGYAQFVFDRVDSFHYLVENKQSDVFLVEEMLSWVSQSPEKKQPATAKKTSINEETQKQYGHALVAAVRQEDLKKIASLLESGISPDSTDSSGEWNALRTAARTGNGDIVKMLINAGADINSKDSYGNTALIIAVLMNKKDAVKILLNAGAEVNSRNHAGKTALSAAISKGYDEVRDILLNTGGTE
jgi:hypothetical protein